MTYYLENYGYFTAEKVERKNTMDGGLANTFLNVGWERAIISGFGWDPEKKQTYSLLEMTGSVSAVLDDGETTEMHILKEGEYVCFPVNMTSPVFFTLNERLLQKAIEIKELDWVLCKNGIWTADTGEGIALLWPDVVWHATYITKTHNTRLWAKDEEQYIAMMKITMKIRREQENG